MCPRYHYTLLALVFAGSAFAADAPVVEFNRDIRPILSDACFTCHGPDVKKRKGDLRLDTEAGARAVLVAGKPQQSPLWQRISNSDPHKQMPPVKSPRQLSSTERKTIQRWIEQGAKWQKHWAFLPPVWPRVPETSAHLRNPIDAFILARLQREGWKLSPEADRTTLIRRTTLDLIGLPPTPEEVDAFLRDNRPGAYERVVDRLLASPRFGERLAIRWLDAARYADTNGYQSDGDRTMWRWRDWVIEAINHNKPFDEFTVEQLAGDLLPRPTLDQRIATGFNRNHRGNAEGGIIPEEYAVEYVADRVETTTTVWLGITMGCSRCHDHKYDPFTMKDFYSLFAFFNNVPERGKAVKYGNSPPFLLSPTRRQQEKLDAIDQQISRAEQARQRLDATRTRTQKAWEASLRAGTSLKPYPEKHLDAHFPKELHLDGKTFQTEKDVGNFGFYDRFSLSAWFRLDGEHGGTIVSRMSDVEQGDGYAVVVRKGRIEVNLIKRWLDDALRVETETQVKSGEWHHVAVSYDGSRVVGGISVYLDGKKVKLRTNLDDLNQTFATKEPFRIGGGGGEHERFKGRLRDVRVYSRVIDDEDARILASSRSVVEIAAIPAAKRTQGEREKLQRYFVEHHASKEIRDIYHSLARLRDDRQALIDAIPTTMVMKEMPQPRQAHLLVRGQYDRPGEKVSPETPVSLGQLRAAASRNRLALARWLMSAENPLTARVTVNRHWQMLFGTGIVRTTEDFGSQGEWPSHPELLDWLAVEFRESGWDVKRLLRLIVTSRTYRQSSAVSEEQLKRDPDNRLLGRAPRLRLSAEMIRDQALAASGLLVERLGGPSVKPYQPAGIWRELADMEYHRDSGSALYRRGLYTFWKRTVPPPGLTTFDASGRETCNVRETRTNTPLQALNLLNDTTFVEASRMLAQRVMREETASRDRLTRLFRLVLSRSPRPEELTILQTSLERHQQRYLNDLQRAKKLLSVGESPVDAKLNPSELAAYTTVASLILNLDEAITRE